MWTCPSVHQYNSWHKIMRIYGCLWTKEGKSTTVAVWRAIHTYRPSAATLTSHIQWCVIYILHWLMILDVEMGQFWFGNAMFVVSNMHFTSVLRLVNPSTRRLQRVFWATDQPRWNFCRWTGSLRPTRGSHPHYSTMATVVQCSHGWVKGRFKCHLTIRRDKKVELKS